MNFWKLYSRNRVVPLGKGISGTVERHETGTSSVVVKTYHSKEKYETCQEYKDRILHEYRVLKQIQHRNFISVLKYEVSYDGGTIKMYMEAGSQDLFILLKNSRVAVPVYEALCLWKQACTGIQYLHALGLCHRDLKLENMVWDPRCGALKIIDLATAAACDSPAAGMVGSRKYMAPETFSQITYEGAPADVWSLGIILFYMITRSFPWKGASHAHAGFMSYSTCSSGTSKLKPLKSRISEDGVDVLARMLCVDAGKRITMNNLIHTPWYEAICFCNGHETCTGVHDFASG